MFAYVKPEQKQEAKSTVQKKDSENPVATPNQTGIPDDMKIRFENLSGFSFDDVRVHYNSNKPAQLQALAYTQGNQVYVAPGQEKHLGHELGHVVQQKQGRVPVTSHFAGAALNTSKILEKEANSISVRQTLGSSTGIVAQLAPDYGNQFLELSRETPKLLAKFYRIALVDLDEVSYSVEKSKMETKELKSKDISDGDVLNKIETDAVTNIETKGWQSFANDLDVDVRERMLKDLSNNELNSSKDLYPDSDFLQDERHFDAKAQYTNNFFTHHFANTYEKARNITTARGNDIPVNTIMTTGQLEGFYNREVKGPPRKANGNYYSVGRYTFWQHHNPAPAKGSTAEKQERNILQATVSFGIANDKINHFAGLAELPKKISQDPLNAFISSFQEIIICLVNIAADNPVLKKLSADIRHIYEQIIKVFTNSPENMDLDNGLNLLIGQLRCFYNIVHDAVDKDDHVFEEAILCDLDGAEDTASQIYTNLNTARAITEPQPFPKYQT